MTALQNFQKTLTEIVSSDKLSSSRVERIRNEAADNFDFADDLAKIIVQVHESAKAKTRISSLYLFDAMARCAQEVIRRKASGFKYKDAKPPKGSSSAPGTKEAMIDAANAFLSACAKIVEEVVLSTAQSVRPDQREKVAKVVDIWIKANTFETGMLERIRSRALRGEGASHTSAGSQEDEKGNSMGSPYGMLMNEDEERSRLDVGKSGTKSPPAPAGIPANLLALLGGSTAKANSTEVAKLPNTTTDQGPPANNNNTSTAGTSLDPNQLAMLRRVAAQQEQDQQRKGSWQRPGSEDRRIRQGSRETSIPPRTEPTKQYQQKNLNVQGETIHENQSSNANANFWADASVGDLSQFDLTSFDPTKSENWLRVAQQWFNTYQYCPSNQELLVGIMSVMQSQMYMQSQMMGGGAGGGGGNYGGFEASDGGIQAEMQHTFSGWD